MDKPRTHALESLLRALISAEIPALQLLGALQAAGFKLPLGTLVNSDGKSYSNHKVRAFIEARIMCIRSGFGMLQAEYGQDLIKNRRHDGAILIGPVCVNIQDTPEEAAAKYVSAINPLLWDRILYLHGRERYLVEKVKSCMPKGKS